MRIGALASVLLVCPAARPALRSFITPEGWLDGYTLSFQRPQRILLHLSDSGHSQLASIRRRYVILPCACVLARMAAESEAWGETPRALYMLPLFSAVTLGLATCQSRVGASMFDYRRPHLLAHTLIAYPFVIRVVISTMRAIRPLRELHRVVLAQLPQPCA